MPIVDLGKVVGAEGKGIPAGGTDGQVLVKDGASDYAGRWETRPESVNGEKPDPVTGDIIISKVPMADNLEDNNAQQSVGEYAIRTTGGNASLSDGPAWLVRIHGRMRHTGYVPESLVMTVIPEERGEGEYPITAELDEDTFKAYVSVSGTTTLTYTTDWSADPALYGVTVTGEPVSGDEIKIVYVKEVRGTIEVSNPTAFASTGWNLYKHADGRARVVKYSDDQGFLVGGNYTALKYSETIDGEKTDITVTGGAFTIPKDGYVWVTGGDGTTTYILMTWSDWTSGYEGDWKAYSESEISLSTLMSTYFPNGLMQVGATADLIDLSMKKTVSNIERMAYNATNLNNAKQSGRPYEYDENYIYLVRETPVENTITTEGKHTACDHGLEIIKGTGVPVMVETLYGKNLKEMLTHDLPLLITQNAEDIEKVDKKLDEIVKRARKDITNDMTNLPTAISEQNLEKYGYQIGDYFDASGFTGASGYRYTLADMDTFYGGYSSYAVVNTHHIGLVVDANANVKWNNSDDTTTGYVGSNLHSYLVNTMLPLIKTDLVALFGGQWSDHLLSHSKLYSTNTGAWAWSNSQYISALTSVQLHGAAICDMNFYHTGEGNKQLDVFRRYFYPEILGNQNNWLRSVASAPCPAYADRNGTAGGAAGASLAYGAVGLILFH